MRLLWVVVWMIAAFLAGCANQAGPQGEPLKVGVMADYPPIIFDNEDGSLNGLEAEFAKRLGEELERPVAFHRYSLAGLFAALDSGEIDIAMSGLSITEARQRHYLFSLPYTTIGQMAMIRQTDAARVSTPGALFHSAFRVGFKTGTTGEALVNARVDGDTFGFESNEAAVQALINGDIDVFIHDAPTVWNLANHRDYSSNLLGLYAPLTREQLAWAMRKDNLSLKAEVDAVLKAWINSGELNRLKFKWMPVKIQGGL